MTALRQPFSYYGGKQKMAKNILPLLPPHKVYVEPFCGGASVFWQKGRPKHITNNDNYREVLNDLNGWIVNFFKVLQDKEQAKELIRLLELTPYSRAFYNEQKEIYKANSEKDPVKRAYCWYLMVSMSFLSMVACDWAYKREGEVTPYTLIEKVTNLDEDLLKYTNRLRSCFIEGHSALKVIESWDCKEALFYCDPPYSGTDQGGYKGYTVEDWNDLCDIAENSKGSFVISNYMQERQPAGAKLFQFEVNAGSAGGRNGSGKGKRTECVWVIDRSEGLFNNDDNYGLFD